MKAKRRKFLELTGTAITGTILFPHFACSNNNNKTSGSVMEVVPANAEIPPPPGLDKFGIQLYTLREDMPKDPKGVLKKLAGYGYQQIESYDGKQGMFWDMKPTEFKSYLNDLGLEMHASHCNIKENFEEKAAQAASIGVKYLICPYVGPQKNMEEWQKIADSFNECGAICKKNGLRFAYHNHAYSFEEFSGIMPHDFLMEQTDPELVDFQMDIYWVVTAGVDPITYLKKYPNRFKLCHVKDRMKNAGDEQKASCDLGTGIIDYSKILKVALNNGMEHIIMEQERYDNSTPLQSAEVGAKYLRELVLT